MDITTALQQMGLSATASRCYQQLLLQGTTTPATLAEQLHESRTNTYKLLDELVKRGLARRQKYKNKLHYEATSPVQLLNLARTQREHAITQEKQLQQQLPALLQQYYKHHEQPGVRFFQGKEGIYEIYAEQIRLGKPIQLLRTSADIRFFGFAFMEKVRKLAPKAGLRRRAFTPDVPEAPKNPKKSDQGMLLERTWYKSEDYTAPVEWDVYGNKVSIISFGEEAVGMVIDSPQIAEAVRQIFALLDEGLRRRPGYHLLPQHGTHQSEGLGKKDA